MPDTALFHLLTYLVSFLVVWYGSGLVVSAVTHISRSWRLPTFTVAFFILGILTSLPEIAIGSLSVLDRDPSIFAGNLLGGVIVLFLGVIPLLGLVSGEVRIPRVLSRAQLVVTLLVIVAPAFLAADQKVTQVEAVFLIALYLSLAAFFSFEQHLFAKVKNTLIHRPKPHWLLLAKIAVGIALVVWSGEQIVASTLFFADQWQISPFFVSLIVVSLGTNIPEIAIIVRSILSRRKDIALADYLGSAAANTLLFGLFTLWYAEPVYLPDHFLQRLGFLMTGLVMFFFFSRSKNSISRIESTILLLVYGAFILTELWFAQN